MKVWYYQSEAQESRRLTMKETAAVFMDCLASLVASVSSTTYAITQMQLLSTLQKWVKLLKKREKI